MRFSRDGSCARPIFLGRPPFDKLRERFDKLRGRSYNVAQQWEFGSFSHPIFLGRPPFDKLRERFDKLRERFDKLRGRSYNVAQRWEFGSFSHPIFLGRPQGSPLLSSHHLHRQCHCFTTAEAKRGNTPLVAPVL